MKEIFDHNKLENLEEKMTEIEFAKLNCALAYQLNSLYYSNNKFLKFKYI